MPERYTMRRDTSKHASPGPSAPSRRGPRRTRGTRPGPRGEREFWEEERRRHAGRPERRGRA